MAQSYRGRPPEDALASVVGPWCTWLRCVECGTTTVHALIVDALADSWRRDRCDRELYDRTADRTWRRIRRRLDALAAEGVTIVRALSPEDMCLDMSLVEVIEYADARRFLIRVCTTADPVRLLRAVELAEDFLTRLTNSVHGPTTPPAFGEGSRHGRVGRRTQPLPHGA